MTADDVFHPVLELELPLLQRDLFELFGFGKVVLGGEFVEAILKFVMLGGEIVKFLVRLQQQIPEAL
jgi:hypothetical protein